MFPRQVFGLTGSTLLAGLPRCFTPVSSSAFVPAYRCGAVPEFHRIPFSLSTMERPRMGPTISRQRSFGNANPLWIFGFVRHPS
jgi:hypothetical protein